jgi:hypothetical protein
VTEEAREVSPFNLDKNRKSRAPQGDRRPPASPDEAREVMPVMFTRPGEDVYVSDDPNAAPYYSDFRAMIVPADSEVEVVGDEEDIPVVPKDLSVLESVTSSTELNPPSQEVTAPPQSTIQIAAESLQAVDKDSGKLKANESSTPTGSSTPTTNDGKNEPPA